MGRTGQFCALLVVLCLESFQKGRTAARGLTEEDLLRQDAAYKWDDDFLRSSLEDLVHGQTLPGAKAPSKVQEPKVVDSLASLMRFRERGSVTVIKNDTTSKPA